jgi:hypothetical protein
MISRAKWQYMATAILRNAKFEAGVIINRTFRKWISAPTARAWQGK